MTVHNYKVFIAGSFARMMSMAFAFLCFSGVFVMFFYLMRSLEKFQEHMRDEHARLRVQLRALEARLDMRACAAGSQTPPPPLASLDHRAPLTLAPEDPLDAVLRDPVTRFEPGR